MDIKVYIAKQNSTYIFTEDSSDKSVFMAFVAWDVRVTYINWAFSCERAVQFMGEEFVKIIVQEEAAFVFISAWMPTGLSIAWIGYFGATDWFSV